MFKSVHSNGGDRKPNEQRTSSRIDCHNALRHGDAALGSLLSALEERHLDGSTLVVVIGDHGEGFGRHGHFGHGADVYDDQTSKRADLAK